MGGQSQDDINAAIAAATRSVNIPGLNDEQDFRAITIAFRALTMSGFEAGLITSARPEGERIYSPFRREDNDNTRMRVAQLEVTDYLRSQRINDSNIDNTTDAYISIAQRIQSRFER